MSTWGAVIQLIAGLIGLYNLWVSRKNGEIAGNDPWGAPTLEWSIPSPPPEYNFDVDPDRDVALSAVGREVAGADVRCSAQPARRRAQRRRARRKEGRRNSTIT